MKELMIIKNANDELVVAVAREHNNINNTTTLIAYGFNGTAMEWFCCEVLFGGDDMTMKNYEIYPELLSLDAEELHCFMGCYIDFEDEFNLITPIKTSCLEKFDCDACVLRVEWNEENLCERFICDIDCWPFRVNFTSIWMTEKFLQNVMEKRDAGFSDSDIIKKIQDKFSEKGYDKPLAGLSWVDVLPWFYDFNEYSNKQ
jgi:hypothetical protein